MRGHRTLLDSRSKQRTLQAAVQLSDKGALTLRWVIASCPEISLTWPPYETNHEMLLFRLFYNRPGPRNFLQILSSMLHPRRWSLMTREIVNTPRRCTRSLTELGEKVHFTNLAESARTHTLWYRQRTGHQVVVGVFREALEAGKTSFVTKNTPENSQHENSLLKILYPLS
jgi:hypothetical protein